MEHWHPNPISSSSLRWSCAGPRTVLHRQPDSPVGTGTLRDGHVEHSTKGTYDHQSATLWREDSSHYPDYDSLSVEFANGALITLGASWDIWQHGHRNMELYGTEGSLVVPDPNFLVGNCCVVSEMASLKR